MELETDRKTQTMMNVLGREFPLLAVKKRRGGGNKDLSYLEGHTVIHRVLEANAEWDWAIAPPFNYTLGESEIMVIIGTLTIPGLGSRQGVGVQKLDQGGKAVGEDMLKGAATDAFKNAAKYFGVGLHLYGDNYEQASAVQELRRTITKQPVMKNQMSQWIRDYLQGETIDEQTPGSVRRLTRALKAQFPEMTPEEAASRK